MTGAFSSNVKSIDEQVNIDAPLFHVVPYVTGGFQRLLRLIKTDSVPDLPEYGYHTNSEGHFDPKGECMIGLRYKVEKILDAKGQSAVLVQAQDEFSHKSVVIKVLHTHFYQLGGQESHVLRKLAVADPLNISHTLRLLTTVAFDSHYCLVFEPMLPDSLTSVFSNIPTNRILTDVRRVGLRLLASVGFLHQQNFIHTDLKPDNILLKHENDLDSVHIVDFGNTINYVHSEVSLYYKDFELQTPLYRAPEVMYGVPFGPEIDIWSLGCILAELVIGKPLFLGTTKEEIMEQMTSLLGPFPAKIFRRGKYYKTFRKYTSEEDQANCTLKLMEHLHCKDIEFADLIAQMLIYNPEERLTVSGAARHPFFSSYLPLAFLLPSSTGASPYPSISLTKESYSSRPHIPSVIRRQPLSPLDLLRQGTTKLPNLEEPNVVRPLPMQGKYREANSVMSTEMEERVFIKGTNMPSNEKTHTDVSVFRNFVVDNKKRKYSKNVKDKMSSLLEAIRQEQDDVEEDLERRDRSAKSGRMREDASERAAVTEHIRREVTLPRPCPRYGRFDVKDNPVNDKTSRKTHSSSDFKMVSKRMNHGKDSRHASFTEPSCSNQNFEHEQMGKIRQLTKKKRSVSEDVDTRLSSQTENTEVFDGSPTAHGVVRPRRTQSAGFEKFSVHEGNKVHGKRASEISFDREQHSVSSGKSNINSSHRENSFNSGYEHNMSEGYGQDASGNNTIDVSESSDYSQDSDTESSQTEVAYSRKPESRSEFSQFSDHSTNTKEMHTLRGQIAEKRQKTKVQYYNQNIPHHSNSASNFKTYGDNPSDFADGTSNFFSKSERGTKMETHCVSQAMPVEKHSMDGRSPRGLVSPNFGSRKRLASESVSDDEEYVELLSPLVARSGKKNVRAANSGMFVTNVHSPYRRHDLQKRIKSDITDSRQETDNKIYKSDQETVVNRLGIHHSKGVSSQKDYRRNSLGSGDKFYDKVYERQQTLVHQDDLTPSSRQRRVDRVDGARKFIDAELPSVTPIKREEKSSWMKDWISESPEIIYKGKVLNTEYVTKEREKSSGLQKTKLGEKGLNNFKGHCLQEHSKRKSLPSGESSKNTSSEVIYTKKIDRKRDLNTGNSLKLMRRNSFGHAEKTKMIPNTIGEVPYKVADYSFKGTPDSDTRHPASRDGYAERIAQISRKRKKARKSLEFDSRRSTAVGYMEKDVNDEVNRDNGSSDSNEDEIMAEDYLGEKRALHTSPNNLHNKFVNLSSIHRISNKQINRRSLNDDLSENQKDNYRRNIDGDRDEIVHRQHVRKPVKCAKDVVAPKAQKDLKYVKKFDSTFTIDFESPLRDYKLNKYN